MSLASNRSKRNTRAPTRFEDEADQPTPSPVIQIEPPTKRKRRRLRNARDNAMRELGRWKPADDLALMLAIQQTNDLFSVYKAVKFSCKFSYQEIEDRWFALLYCAPIQRVAMAALRQLNPDIVAQIHIKSPFSAEEEELLKTICVIPGRPPPCIETFKKLLDEQGEAFLTYRTEKHLKNHWMSMRHHNLIPVIGLSGQPIQSRRDELPNFSEVEETVDKDILNTLAEHIATNFDGQTVASKLKDDSVHQELMINARRVKREIRRLENELPKWQALVDSIKGVPQSDFDESNVNLAVLRGRHMRYLMILKQITFGRSTKQVTVDVDLSLEGPAAKISRKQGMIELQANGEFIIVNTGRRPFYVDAQPVLGNGHCLVIHNNAVVEISGLRFVFLINQDLIERMRQAVFSAPTEKATPNDKTTPVKPPPPSTPATPKAPASPVTSSAPNAPTASTSLIEPTTPTESATTTAPASPVDIIVPGSPASPPANSTSPVEMTTTEIAISPKQEIEVMDNNQA